MRKRNIRFGVLLVLFAALTLPLVIVHGSGGRIEGKVTDPKGAAVAGASVTVTDEVNNQTFTGVTDQQGRYKIEGLAAGVYTVVISATGFSEARKESVKLDEGATLPLDQRLEIAALEASVTVPGGAIKANADPIYQQLRQRARANTDSSGTNTTEGQQPDFAGSYATVNNLVLKKEGATFTLRNGEIYFVAPVLGRYTGGVFIGDGEFSLVPPTENEKNSLKIFTNEPSITEQFTSTCARVMRCRVAARGRPPSQR